MEAVIAGQEYEPIFTQAIENVSRYHYAPKRGRSYPRERKSPIGRFSVTCDKRTSLGIGRPRAAWHCRSAPVSILTGGDPGAEDRYLVNLPSDHRAGNWHDLSLDFE